MEATTANIEPLSVWGKAGKLDSWTRAERALNVATWCCADAVTKERLSVAGSRTTADASPLTSVIPDADSIFAPGEAVQLTAAPGTEFPPSSFKTTTRGVRRAAPGAPDCPSPRVATN